MTEKTTIRVLLVEDALEDAEIFRRYAGGSALYRVEVDHVTRSDEVMERLSEAQYDILFLDQRLGEAVTGLEILERITSAGVKLPVVVVTGTGDQDLAVQMMKAGAMDYLLKDNFDGQVLDRSIRYSLAQHSLTVARKNSEQKLRRSEERFRMLFQGLPDAVLVHDEQGNILHVNDVGVEQLKWPVGELVGMNLREIITSENVALIGDHVREARREGGCSFRTTYVSRTGRLIRAEVSERPIEFEGKEAILSVARDVTEQEALREQLQHSQKLEAIGELAGGVAHDFSNMLQVMGGYARLTLQALDDDNPLAGNMEEICRAADRAGSLTQQLLAFARRQTLEVKALALNDIVKDARKLLRRLIREDIDLVMDLSEDAGNVEADPARIQQVILNIALNAADAMPDGGELTFETRNLSLNQAYCDAHPDLQPGPWVMLAITDTGCGMDQETKERIFEPFFSTKEQGKGTGLGLSTAYGIVKQHGGDIWVYSERGRGTALKLCLPRLEAQAGQLATPAEEGPLPEGNETILVVEDEDPTLRTVKTMLEGCGYQVLSATTAGEAETLLARYQGQVHLLLTDVILTDGWNGRQLSRRLAQMEPSLKVLYMSGYAGNVLARHGILDPGIDLLEKPFGIEDLARKVRELLDR